jgi:prefoldin subunit 5
MYMEYVIGVIYMVITVLIYTLGIYVGSKTYVARDIDESIEKVKKKMQEIHKTDVGMVKRPTQEQIELKHDPYLQKVESGKDAMSELLKNIKHASQD